MNARTTAIAGAIRKAMTQTVRGLSPEEGIDFLQVLEQSLEVLLDKCDRAQNRGYKVFNRHVAEGVSKEQVSAVMSLLASFPRKKRPNRVTPIPPLPRPLREGKVYAALNSGKWQTIEELQTVTGLEYHAITGQIYKIRKSITVDSRPRETKEGTIRMEYTIAN